MDYKRYVLPGILTGVLFGALLGSSFLSEFFKRKPPAKEEPALEIAHVPQIVHLPHGRVLYIVIEEDGFYLGKECVPFSELQKYLSDHQFQLKPDYVLICGISGAPFGRAVEALEATRSVFKVPYTVDTITVPEGTRRGPIEVHEHPWEY